MAVSRILSVVPLLLIAISVPAVRSLRCYQCVSVGSLIDCERNSTGPCGEGQDACMTTAVTALSVTTYTKSCSLASLCIPTDVHVAGIGTKVTCCTTDLCNASGAGPGFGRRTPTTAGPSLALALLVAVAGRC
ncbi:ly6/PLAUR domain-containing protein 2-like [Lethenteron reissneri]|uniref:ly6/PLAUR domain-containing protein 2-like n=1 Tax=Lethenteron reissneri TaxID=7753 RepID=UPI002AB5DF1D|nr:ly6/PLAUR domain-containing protein 2-like [Lethenteron reissneri]